LKKRRNIDGTKRKICNSTRGGGVASKLKDDYLKILAYAYEKMILKIPDIVNDYLKGATKS
jgi:hypothetical protein